MKNTKKLVFSAMMTALCVIIGWVCKSYLTFGAIRVTFENLPILLAGILLGPTAGACVGAASDIISALLSGYSINPVITLGAASVGTVAGLFSKYIYKRKGFLSVLWVTLISHLVGSVAIKSFGLWMMGYALPVVAMRLPLYVAIAAVEAYLLYLILKNRQFISAFKNKEMKK